MGSERPHYSIISADSKKHKPFSFAINSRLGNVFSLWHNGAFFRQNLATASLCTFFLSYTSTHTHTRARTLLPSPRDTLLRYRNPVCHLIKWPTQTDGFAQTACNAFKERTIATANQKHESQPPSKQTEGSI